MRAKKVEPVTREDVLKLIEKNGGTAEGLDLSALTFEPGVDLSYLDLSGTDFHDARLSRANFNGSTLQDADFRGAILGGADFREADLLCANLKECNLDGTKLEGALIEGAEIAEAKLGAVDWGNYIIEEENHEESIGAAESQYRDLKIWYSSRGYYDIAAKFYYREKEANRKQIKWNRKKWRHFLSAWAARWLFGYGERWKRILICMAVVIFGSALLYNLLGGLNRLYSLYFSVVSFTALGYAKWVYITPQGWVKALGAAESFVGVLMMALLLVTFFRKWTR